MAQWHSRRDFLKRSIVWTIGTTWVGAAIDALAQAPQLLNYQGRLTDANGAPRNGSFPMSFAILGGTSTNCAGGIVEIQGTAEKIPFTEEQLLTLLALAKKGIGKLVDLQKLAVM